MPGLQDRMGRVPPRPQNIEGHNQMNRKITIIATITAGLLSFTGCTRQQIADAIALHEQQVAEQTVEPAATPSLPWVHEGEELASATGPFNIIMRVGEGDSTWRVRCQSIYSGTPSMVPTSEAVAIAPNDPVKIPVCLNAADNS